MTHFAILGGGRLARHMRHYFALLGLPHSAWARNPSPDLNTHGGIDSDRRLRKTLEPATHALVLISDDAIPGFLTRHPALQDKTVLHCSGTLSLPGIAGAHPLMTFGPGFYTLEEYRRIPFMVDSGHRFEHLLPGLPNPHFPIALEHKPRYHALCVMAGNFSQILWQGVTDRFADIGLPATALEPYLHRVVGNFTEHPETALTGPLSRGDRGTIERNLQALAGDNLQPVYQAFLDHWNAETGSGRNTEVAS
ncbi:DUF2520 domain-containing protein [Elongatibacter sediminis]|uniref:DUF2520 domain-containing protein n=1 Tax=Elongatibacter sediminis TaxID=3119006 RepID=A0AAW9RP72_9GAMM